MPSFLLTIKIKSIEARLKECPELKVTFFLDHARAFRLNDNCVEILRPLVAAFGERFNVFCWRPSHWVRQILPTKVNEILGVHHMKFIVSDSNILLSGANLSRIYFENRIDRYLLIKGNLEFASFFISLSKYLQRHYLLMKNDGTFINCGTKAELEPFLARTSVNLPSGPASRGGVWIAPCIQLPFAKIDHDLRVLVRLIQNFCETKEMDQLILSTSYFNPCEDVEKLLLTCPKNLTILTSSPQSNGFNGAKGLSGYIPMLYDMTLSHFAQKMSSRTRISEWERPEYTFHAKGNNRRLYIILPRRHSGCIQ